MCRPTTWLRRPGFSEVDYGIQYTATLDYVVSVRVVDDENNPVANCNEDGVAGSYLLYTVLDDRSWGRKVTLSALCISGLGSKTLVVELLNGSSEYLGRAEFVLSTERDIVGQLNEAGIPSPMETATHRY